eukprot:TRINITY_DN5376_c0_g1_i2.p3 TRINITY_DN5376_c0_g1~~TRINITY_DN5376_c0_g1_i2.p3  ORF type:complete len:60 (-),score=9.61 TRINITY_DN5376_c0_g1_i2:401-580(-)
MIFKHFTTDAHVVCRPQGTLENSHIPDFWDVDSDLCIQYDFQSTWYFHSNDEGLNRVLF